MDREHPQYNAFQKARMDLTYHDVWKTRTAADAAAAIKWVEELDRKKRTAAIIKFRDIGHPDMIPLLTAKEQGINDSDYQVRAIATDALREILEKTSTEQPNNKLVINVIPVITEKLNIHFALNEPYNQGILENLRLALITIAEKIKITHPDHILAIAANHINPNEHWKAFFKFYQALMNGEHLGQPPAWITTYAKQLKALEGNLK